jgi:hypothetical protein
LQKPRKDFSSLVGLIKLRRKKRRMIRIRLIGECGIKWDGGQDVTKEDKEAIETLEEKDKRAFFENIGWQECFDHFRINDLLEALQYYRPHAGPWLDKMKDDKGQKAEEYFEGK